MKPAGNSQMPPVQPPGRPGAGGKGQGGKVREALRDTVTNCAAISVAVAVIGTLVLNSDFAGSLPLSWVDALAAVTRAAWVALAVIVAGWAVWKTQGRVISVPAAVLLTLLKALGDVLRPAPTATTNNDERPPSEPAPDTSPLGAELPPLDLLAEDHFLSERRHVLSDAAVEVRAAKVRATLEKLRIPVVSIGAPIVGPAVTRFEFRVGEAARAGQVERVGRDVGAALGTQDVRVIYPVPGKPETVGIEVPNDRVARVYLRGILAELRGRDVAPLTVALGRGLDGQPVFHDLAALPHLLIGGTTGSGKSSLLHALLCSLLCRLTPEQLRFVFIDPKMVELAPYKELPHTLAMSSHREDAAAALAWAVEETNRRYPLLLQAGVRDIRRYNTLTGVDPLPHIVVVVDEVAELMLGDKETRKAIEDSVQSLSQKARAAGVHLIVATQRPSVDVISGVIKANIPSRIALSVATSVDSGVILDQPGAEALVGRGDMLFLPVGAKAPVRVQSAYVTEEEVAALVAWWRSRCPASIQEEAAASVIGGRQCDGSGAGGDGESDEGAPEEVEAGEDASADPLLAETARWLASQETVSVRSLREGMGIGTYRATALLNLFAEIGWIGQAQGARPRPVLLSREARADVQRGVLLPKRCRRVTGGPEALPEIPKSAAETPETLPERTKSVTWTGEKALPEALPEAEAPIEEPRAVTPTEGDLPAVCHRCRQVVARLPRGMAARLRCPECGEEVMVG